MRNHIADRGERVVGRMTLRVAMMVLITPLFRLLVTDVMALAKTMRLVPTGVGSPQTDRRINTNQNRPCQQQGHTSAKRMFNHARVTPPRHFIRRRTEQSRPLGEKPGIPDPPFGSTFPSS